MGVKTIALTENKGALAGALVVREHEELVFISAGGMVQRTAAGGITRTAAPQGVRLMNLKDDDMVSAVALVVGASEPSDEGGLRRSRTGPARRRHRRQASESRVHRTSLASSGPLHC